MTDYQQAIAAARAAYNRLLREDCTAQACQLAEGALRLLLAAIDAQEPVAWRYRRYADQSWQRPEYSPGCRVGDGDEWQPLYAAPTAADEALADTQRAIIEAAERRGYERGLKDASPAAAASKTDTARFLTADIDWIDRIAERLAAEDWDPWLRLRRAMISDAELRARRAPE